MPEYDVIVVGAGTAAMVAVRVRTGEHARVMSTAWVRHP
jgi:succinate dehydrogenase/fumarate reductase flavoprotein subunit